MPRKGRPGWEDISPTSFNRRPGPGASTTHTHRRSYSALTTSKLAREQKKMRSPSFYFRSLERRTFALQRLRASGSSRIGSLYVFYKDPALRPQDIDRIRRIAVGMKFIWREVSESLFTLKLHCFIDHSILEDMPHCGSVYHWTSSGFESVHRKLQLRMSRDARNCEETIVKNFVVKNKLIHDLCREATNTRHRYFIALNDAIAVGKKRFPPSKMLSTQWYFPVNSNVRFSSLDESHQIALRGLHRDSILSSRFVRDFDSHKMAFCSRTYWTRTSPDSEQSCVQLVVGEEVVFGDVLLFIYDPVRNTCSMIMDEFVLEDPFLALADNISRDVTSPARERCINTLSLLLPLNRFFKRVIARELTFRPAFDIKSSAVTVSLGGHLLVSQIP